jgi:hypothetical protein
VPEAATSDGTRRRADRAVASGAAAQAYRTLGRTGLTVSAFGFGGYRIDEHDAGHARALERALTSGCNLVDTSTNYADGGSEACIGRVLSDLFGTESLRRDEVVVVSKVGYVQGRNLELARERERAGNPFPDMVRYADSCWHCIHPAFIADQIGRSLERLRLMRLDACLLHNPEYFLADAVRHGRSVATGDARAELDRRLEAAFAHLEDEVDRGRIGCYGVSSNTCVSPVTDPEATSVARMLEIARGVAQRRTGDAAAHRFSVLQLPLNLLEPGAALERNNASASRTALEEARDAGLGVLVNRPLNAFAGGRLTRLADFPLRCATTTVDDAAARVAALEAELDATVDAAGGGEAGGLSAAQAFRWGAELGGNARRFSGLEHWREFEASYMRPRLDHLLRHFSLHLVGRARSAWAAWTARYVPAMEELLQAIGDEHRRVAQATSDAVSSRLDPLLPTALRGEPLSRKALAVLAGTPGVSCVLVGMRREEYVDDVTTLLARTTVPVPADLYARFTAS